MNIPVWAMNLCVCLVASLLAMLVLFIFVEVLWLFCQWGMRAAGVYRAFLAFLWTRNRKRSES